MMYYDICQDKDICGCEGCPLNHDGSKLCHVMGTNEAAKYIIDQCRNLEPEVSNE